MASLCVFVYGFKMQQIKTFDNIHVSQNTLLVDSNKSSLINSTITFHGRGNVLIIEDGVNIINSDLQFRGDGAIVYISCNKYQVKINVQAWTNTVLYVGEHVHFTGPPRISLSEEQNVLIGDLCTFAVESVIRTSDAHLIYDCNTRKRINPSKPVLIGEKVWIGQGVTILKGTTVGSGSIVGTCSVVSNKRIGSNECWAGNPAKLIRRGVFWSGVCTHNFTTETAATFNFAKGKYNGFVFDKTIDCFYRICEIDPADIQQKLSYLTALRQ